MRIQLSHLQKATNRGTQIVEPAEHISEQHPVEAKASPKPKPLGDVILPAMICGAVGAILTITLSLIGRYDGLDQLIKEYYMAEPFYMAESSDCSPVWNWLLVIMLTFGISFVVMDTDKRWRRMMIILLFSVVLLLSSPVLMLWDVFWSPITVFVGMLWSWICAFIYSCQHTMPCELLLPEKSCIEEEEEIDVPIFEEFEGLDNLEENLETSEKKYQPKDTVSCPD